ncbi:MAG TPA: phenylalanine--tRNA ligase subunit alpha, partial [Acidimicrobiia bacterium]
MSLDDLRRELDDALADARAAVEAVDDLDDLAARSRALLGKRSPAARAKEAIKDLDPADRPAAGRALAEHQEAVDGLLAARRGELAGRARPDAGPFLDLTVGGHGRRCGHLHLVTQIRRELEDIFIGLGYRVAEGPEVEDDWHNFE